MNPIDLNKKKKSNPKFQNFIEAFKDIGASTVKTFTQDVVGGTAKNALDVLTKGQTNSAAGQNPEAFDFEEFLNLQENKIRQQERARFESIRRDEQVIFSREQQQVKIQIETIQTQIKALTTEQVGLMKEVDKATFQAVVDPGTYHQNFFERLLHLIKLARKNIVESRTWLQLHNHRAQKRTGYWQNVKSGGTQYLLSQERYMSTQAG